jgi:hypothetical protein
MWLKANLGKKNNKTLEMFWAGRSGHACQPNYIGEAQIGGWQSRQAPGEKSETVSK